MRSTKTRTFCSTTGPGHDALCRIAQQPEQSSLPCLHHRHSRLVLIVMHICETLFSSRLALALAVLPTGVTRVLAASSQGWSRVTDFRVQALVGHVRSRENLQREAHVTQPSILVLHSTISFHVVLERFLASGAPTAMCCCSGP